MSKSKWTYFGVLTAMLVFSISIAVIYCDILVLNTVPNNIAQLLIKPKDSDMLFYNLSVSYIVSYMFYLLVNFIPDCLYAIEKEKKSLPLRHAIQNEIRLFLGEIISLWLRIAITASEKGNIDLSSVNSIDKFFEISFIQQVSEKINISESINYITPGYSRSDWKTEILAGLESISERGNLIITRYKYDIPPEISYIMFYMLNNSFIISNLSILINNATAFGYKNLTLSQCIHFESEGNCRNIEKSCSLLFELFKWINSEANYLKKKFPEANDNIFEIKFNAKRWN